MVTPQAEHCSDSISFFMKTQPLTAISVNYEIGDIVYYESLTCGCTLLKQDYVSSCCGDIESTI